MGAKWVGEGFPNSPVSTRDMTVSILLDPCKYSQAMMSVIIVFMSTKLGIIADIHGDYKSLQRALSILDTQGVNEILCAGDLVMKGPAGDAVVNLTRQRRILCVRGNHDQKALNIRNWQRFPEGERLSPETLKFLGLLPHVLRMERADTTIRITHGTPRRISEYLFHFVPDQMVKQIVAQAGVDVLILGHTHIPMRIRVGEKWVVNPGSVCTSGIGDSGTCAILTLPDREFIVYSVHTGEPVNYEKRSVKT